MHFPLLQVDPSRDEVFVDDIVQLLAQNDVCELEHMRFMTEREAKNLPGATGGKKARPLLKSCLRS